MLRIPFGLRRGIAFFAGVLALVAAEPPPDRFFRLTEEEGLAHSDVRAIAQDHAGFMWFGLRLGGLTRYDGYEFKVYQHDPEDPRSLGSRVIWSLLVDRTGTLWIGTEGGLDRLDAATGTFTHYRHDPSRPDSLPNNVVVCLYEDAAGHIWAGTRDGLARLDDRERGSFTTFRRPQVIPGSTQNNTFRAITEDPSTGLFWLGASDGLAAFDPRTGAFASYLHDPADAQSLSNNAVNMVVRDPAGGLWALTEYGLNAFKPDFTGIPEHAVSTSALRFTRHFPDDVASPGIQFMRGGLFDDAGRLWIASRGGVQLFDPATGAFTVYQRRVRDPTSLGDNLTQAIFMDRAGDIWVGTYAAGANLLRLGAKPFRIQQHDPANPRSLTEDRISGLAFDAAGRLWAGTVHGLNRRDASGWTRFLHDPADPGSLHSNDVSTLAITPGGDVWVGSNYRGAARFDGTRFHSFLMSPSNVPAPDGWHAFTGGQVNALLPSPNGGVWVGARAYGLDFHRDGRFRHYTPQEAAPGRAAQPTTNAIFGFETEDGHLWFATETSGLVRLHIASGRFTAFQPPTRATGINHSLHCMARTDDGHIWLGAADGLFRFDPATEQFLRHYTVADGLPHAAVVNIVRDRRGHLWIGTANGLADFDPVSGKFRVYEKPDGLPSNVFAQRAGVLGPDGRVYLGTRAGIVDFDPAQLRDNPTPPPVVLTELRWLGPSPEDADARPESSFHVPDTIRVPAGQPGFILKYSALDFSAPEKNRFRHRLEGWDETWRETGARERSATYTALPPGSYVFRVQASNPDLAWNTHGASVRIIVLPHFWQTWWFRVLLILLLAGLIAAILHRRLRSIRRDNLLLEQQVSLRTAQLEREVAVRQQAEASLRESHAELERRVEARTSELARTNASLQAEMAERRNIEAQLRQSQKMEAVGQLAGGIAHDFNNLLTVILGQSSLLTDPTLPPGARVDAVRDIKAAAQRATNLTRQLLVFSRRQAMNPAPVDLNQVVLGVAKLLGHVLGENIARETDLPGELPVLADAGMLEQVILNLAVNARDAMPRGGRLQLVSSRVDVSPEKAARTPGARPGPHARLAVIDTGCGIAEEVLPHIFDPFFTTKEAGKGTGLGLAISLGIVQQHGGWIEVETQRGHGTTFAVFLPAHAAALVPTASAPTPAPAGPAGNATVLLTEDEDAVRSVARRMLERQGYRIIEAANAREALERWKEHHHEISILVTDIVMPGPLNGHDLAARLLAEKPSLRVVTMSGYDPREFISRPSFAGFHLRKPFAIEDLLRAVGGLDPSPGGP